MSARLMDETDGSASPDFLLPTPSAQESTPTDEFLDEVRDHLDPDDPLHRLWLPGRKWMTQRTLSRVVPALVADGDDDEDALLPTPGAWLGRRPENATADPERAASRQHEGTRGKRSLELPDALAEAGIGPLLPTPVGSDARGLTDGDLREGGPILREIDRLLPTPTAGDAKASGSRNLAGSKAHPGVSLTDAIQTGDSTTPRLLPTPQAADGDGGRQEKTAMGAAGRRPSGQKGTLPLGTAVGMRETISESPFTEETESGQVTLLPTPTAEDGERGRNGSGSDRLGAATFDPLLPTPVANEENPGAGGEFRAAVVHGEGRRNETGTDTMGRPNTGRPSRLLPTPTAADGENASEQGPRHYIEGSDNPTLLGAARRTTGELRHSDDPDLLPTPTAGDGREPSDHPAPGPAVLKDAAQGIAWGVYEAAIRRWERILGREAPVPTDEKGRLAPAFVEWMLGYPEGWVSAIDIPRTAQLRILGNSVQVDCGERVGDWLARLSLSGVI